MGDCSWPHLPSSSLFQPHGPVASSDSPHHHSLFSPATAFTLSVANHWLIPAELSSRGQRWRYMSRKAFCTSHEKPCASHLMCFRSTVIFMPHSEARLGLNSSYATSLQASHLTSLGLGVLICEMGILAYLAEHGPGGIAGGPCLLLHRLPCCPHLAALLSAPAIVPTVKCHRALA